ncbi:hypothetical protein N0Y54_31330, partial [Nostoc punctiforme UO1]|uniref:hypothetical protein n=1 Tax=Nostoc punctiforme TaxID=272131 RepID=UPI003099677B
MGWAEEPVPSIDKKDFCKRSIIEGRQPSFNLKSVTRVLNDGSCLYLDLYIFAHKEQLKPDRLI